MEFDALTRGHQAKEDAAEAREEASTSRSEATDAHAEVQIFCIILYVAHYILNVI